MLQAEKKQAHVKKMQDMAKGHGQVRTITQDEFLRVALDSGDYYIIAHEREFLEFEGSDSMVLEIQMHHNKCSFSSSRIRQQMIDTFLYVVFCEKGPTHIWVQKP